MFVVVVSLVRYWGAEEFGAYNLAFAYISIFTIFADFGMSTIVVREVAKNRDLSEKYLANLMGLKLFLSVLIALLFGLSFIFVNKPVSIELLILVLVYTLIQNFQGIFVTIFQAWEKMDMVFANRMVYFVGVLVTAMLVISFGGQAVHLVLGYTAATMLAIVLGIWQSWQLKIKVRFAFDLDFWKELLRESWPLLGMTAATIIYGNNDTLLIGRYFGKSDVGFYQTAYKILFAFQSINVINYAIFPRMTVLFHQENKDTAKRLVKMVVGLSVLGLVPLAAVITWQKDLILKMIYGQNFVVAAGVMSLLVWSGVINYFRVLAGNLLVIKKKQKTLMISVLIGTLLNLGLNYFLVPKFGFVQAGWNLVISETVILVLMTGFLTIFRQRDN